MQSTESLLSISLNSSLQTYGGDIAVGAMTILSSIMQVLILPIMGLTQGAQPIISYNYGANNTERVKKTFKLLIISTVSYSTIFWIFVMLFPRLPISLFSTDPVLVKTTVWALRIYMGAAFVWGAQSACQQTFIAVGQAKVSILLALLRKMVLLIPLIYILPNFFDNKVFAVLFAEPISDFFAATTTLIIFSIQFRKILSNKFEVERE
jgi:Na+-driven multidrug efflux pump